MAAIYSLVIYQSQKNEQQKIWPAQRTVAKAASLPLKRYQQQLLFRYERNQRDQVPANNLVFARLNQAWQ